MLKHFTKFQFKISVIPGVFIGIMIISACSDDSVEDIRKQHFGEGMECDTTEVSFSSDVLPIIESNCADCHSGDFPSAQLRLTNYEEISVIAEDSRLTGVVTHSEGYPEMPEGEEQLPVCQINMIKAWVNQGINNN